MSRTASTMVELGTVAPPFVLRDVRSSRTLGRDDLVSSAGSTIQGGVKTTEQSSSGGRRGLLVMFVCVHCPYVKHVEAELGRLGRDYAVIGAPIAMVAIGSNDLDAHPEDGPEGMREQAERCGWVFPYLLDDTQAVARSYGAACTPDFFLFDRDLRLAYRGQLDGSRPRRGDFGNDEPVTGVDLRRALDDVIAGRQPDPNQQGSIGCNIKWRLR